MTDMTVAELKANFSEILHRVQDGEEYRILYGRSHRPVARLTAIEKKPATRKIGVLKGKIFLTEDIYKFKSTEEFLGLE
jgi:prevent-host-death family protein